MCKLKTYKCIKYTQDVQITSTITTKQGQHLDILPTERRARNERYKKFAYFFLLKYKFICRFGVII